MLLVHKKGAGRDRDKGGAADPLAQATDPQLRRDVVHERCEDIEVDVEDDRILGRIISIPPLEFLCKITLLTKCGD